MKISLSTERMVKEKKLTIVFYTRVCVHTNTAIYIYIYKIPKLLLSKQHMCMEICLHMCVCVCV